MESHDVTVIGATSGPNEVGSVIIIFVTSVLSLYFSLKTSE